MNSNLPLLHGGEGGDVPIIIWIILGIIVLFCGFLFMQYTNSATNIASIQAEAVASINAAKEFNDNSIARDNIDNAAIIAAQNQANSALTNIKMIKDAADANNISNAQAIALIKSETKNIDNFKHTNYLYYPEDAIIYQDIFNAYSTGVIAKSGNPVGWDETTHNPTNPWNNFPIMRIGGVPGGMKGLTFPDGLKVTVPAGKNILWVRALSDRWTCLELHKADGTYLFTYATGYNNLNRYAPDGGSADAGWNVHCWMAIPVPAAGDYVLVPGNKVNDGGGDLWLSGVAFSSNPWNHAYNSALAYHWIINGGTALRWHTHDWNNDQLASIDLGLVYNLIVPIVPSGKDKLLYIVEHNNQWNGIMHKSVKVDGVPIERFRTTWKHPLAIHHNSKMYERFIATRIPEALTRGKTSITVEVDMTQQNHHIHCREIGTVDAF